MLGDVNRFLFAPAWLILVCLLMVSPPTEAATSRNVLVLYSHGRLLPANIEAERGLAEVLRYRNTWLIFFAPQGISGATIAFGGLWGVPYLVSVYGFSSERAAFYCSALMLAWALGGPLMIAAAIALVALALPRLLRS